MNLSFRILCFLSCLFFFHNVLSMLNPEKFNQAKALLKGDCSETFNDVINQEGASREIIVEVGSPIAAVVASLAPVCVLKALSPSKQYVAYDPSYRPPNPEPCDEKEVKLLFKKKKQIEKLYRKLKNVI